MNQSIKALFVDTATSYYKMHWYPVGDFFGPIDLGIHLFYKYQSLNFGVGLLAGSVFGGSNRLFFTGFSPAWSGFYISSMGGAGLVFDDLGINLVSLVNRAPTPSILYLNRVHSEEIAVEIVPVALAKVWAGGRQGVYALMDHVMELFGGHYEADPRILAVGPAAQETDFGAIASVPIVKGQLTAVDTWAGRGGLGSQMLRQHNIAAVIYGGTSVHEDFRDRKVADQWFQDKFNKTLAAKDIESTMKYRFRDDLKTGGTFGCNFATIKGRILAFNYRSIYMDEGARVDLTQKLVTEHYLKQFNEETIATKQFKTCGEPCVAVCKKMRGEYKKDYEPYQTLGPLSGVFDQRAAEKLNMQATVYGLDAIGAGCVVAWLMECLGEGLLQPQDLGLAAGQVPNFDPAHFDVEADSARNAEIGVGLMDAMIQRRGLVDLREGARKFARHLARAKDRRILDLFVYNANGRNGWMTPNQYWVPGALTPVAMTGKYYFNYENEFLPPRDLGRSNAERLKGELVSDNMGICRFHRGWSEAMVPEIMGQLFQKKDAYLKSVALTAARINSRNSSVFWETERNIDFVHTALKRMQTVDSNKDAELARWVEGFEKDRKETALSFWYEVHKGMDESLREFQ